MVFTELLDLIVNPKGEVVRLADIEAASKALFGVTGCLGRYKISPE